MMTTIRVSHFYCCVALCDVMCVCFKPRTRSLEFPNTCEDKIVALYDHDVIITYFAAEDLQLAAAIVVPLLVVAIGTAVVVYCIKKQKRSARARQIVVKVNDEEIKPRASTSSADSMSTTD